MSPDASGPLRPAFYDRWLALKADAPTTRARDAADRLGVSEAELVACRPEPETTRLDAHGLDLLRALTSVGPVMALTRNQWAVHEKTGVYDEIGGGTKVGIVLNKEIDLRLFFRHWAHAFACREETRSGPRRSLQVFDAEGTAVHKVYLVAESDEAAFDTLVDRFRVPPREVAIEAIVEDGPTGGPAPAAELESAWRAMTDTHQFHDLLKRHRVARLDAFRMVPDDLAVRVPNDAVRRVLETASAAAAPIMVFVGSRGVIQIHTGPVSRLMEAGPWYNVLDPGFNLHLRMDGIVESWVVHKPTSDGIVTSLEIFDGDGRTIALLFGARKPGEAEREDWREIVASLGTVTA